MRKSETYLDNHKDQYQQEESGASVMLVSVRPQPPVDSSTIIQQVQNLRHGIQHNSRCGRLSGTKRNGNKLYRRIYSQIEIDRLQKRFPDIASRKERLSALTWMVLIM